jgi:RecB family exonuclease
MKTLEDYIRPSALAMNALCPGAPAMQAEVVNLFGEEPTAPEASVGTKVHAYVAQVIEIWKDAHDDVTWGEIIASVCNSAARDGVDRWSVWCIQLCAEFARDLIAKHEVEREFVLVEHQLDMVGAGFHRKGTADLVLVLPFERIVVVDWKAGFLDQGDADVHDQLAAYGAAAAVSFKADEVLVYLYQPRAEKDRRATGARFDAAKVRATAAWAVAVNNRCRANNPELNPSYDACKHCKALHRCAAAEEWTVRLLEAFAAIGDPTDPDAWGETIGAAKIAEKKAEAAIDAGKRHLAAGGEATGWGLQPGRVMTKIEPGEAIRLARDAGTLDQLLEFASFKAEAAKVVPGIVGACRSVPTAASLKPAKAGAAA